MTTDPCAETVAVSKDDLKKVIEYADACVAWGPSVWAARKRLIEAALIDGSMHPAACGPRCRSQHTDDHSQCEHINGPGGGE